MQPAPGRAITPPVSSVAVALRGCLMLVAVVFGLGLTGCAHAVRIETSPVGARVSVDGETPGKAPLVVRRTVFVGDQLRVAVDAEGYEPQTVIVPASEWYPWPGLLACTPALGVPIAAPFAIGLLPFCGAGLFVGPAIAVGWAVVTSPTLLSLGLVRKFPDRVVVRLRRRGEDGGVVLPGELFYVPDDQTPNPPPLGGPDEPVPPTPPGPRPLMPPSDSAGNPVP
ncbi:MAG: PEGA domain-containing protein [Deltaproteobacteria bacterium]|nr:PEGA domain-containing protein [Deltaproteobacteria bacterium]